ncbi:hypothetical protein SAMN04487910_2658 [Aquimarina amphilecti]|uniref:Outer membrane protein beta-barrel domain-containing protein n=1 Tax=Aquimarina amphilecti TaxID=1038014 RepID=A0A1H7QRC5_AQUAM|nr:hypothetical protein [Aquimarina amphilecti]SEL50493.1 hypothetical protein SAMN04487910_2658 [Aquimarina amphilecti]
MTKIILSLIFLLSISNVFAQADSIPKKNSLEFSTGYINGYLKNLSFAPVARYDYNALNYQLKYTRITKRDKLFEVQLDYLNSELETNIIPEPNPQYSKIVLNVSSLKQVYNKERLKIHLGLQTQSNVSSFYDWEQYDFQQKLGIVGRFTFQIDDKQSLSSKLTIPSVMWRTSTFEEKFYSLGKYQSILWSTDYSYKLSNHFDVKASYNFNYDRLQISNAFRELQHQINLGINYKF